MGKQFQLLLRKGVYPYEYMGDWEKFEEYHFPRIEAFYSKLSLSGISECDYGHAQRFWTEFGMLDFEDYYDLYLKPDVLLLFCNVFKTFRKTRLEHYILKPAQFSTSPLLAWQACFKKTEASLELLTDLDMLLKKFTVQPILI